MRYLLIGLTLIAAWVVVRLGFLPIGLMSVKLTALVEIPLLAVLFAGIVLTTSGVLIVLDGKGKGPLK